MTLYSKKKDKSPAELCERIRERALLIIRDNVDEHLPEIRKLKEIRNEISSNHPNIDSGRATLTDVMSFCQEYGCSADFLLGLDERMYR